MSSKLKNMQTTKTSPVIFDTLKTLYVIEHDGDLKEIFCDGRKDISFNVLRTFAKLGTLPEETVENLNEIFTRVITKTKKLLSMYNKITVEEIENSTKPPKHYGKERILEDIKNNGGKTELDRAMLALNDMRNAYAKLKRRCIKDKTTAENTLTRAQYREIIAVTRVLQNKVDDILNKN